MRLALYLTLLSFLSVNYFSSQEKFKIMTYNTLNLQSTSTDRFPHFKKVIDEVKPDILALQEVATAGALNAFKSNVLDGTYACGSFIDGPDTDRCLCYKLNKFKLVSHVAIPTNLRDINQFTLVNLATSDTLRIFVVHLKASDSDADAMDRNQEIQKLRTVTNTFNLNQHYIVLGDFNLYRSTEPAYQLLKNVNSSQNGYVIDPIDMPGEWGVFNYRQYHTQSPRTTNFGGGVSGGMDDRFDLILYSKSISNPGGLDYIPNSTKVIGNDGNHYNLAVNDMPNTSVSLEIANALHEAADHLPVVAEFIYNPPLSVNKLDQSNVKIFPNPVKNKLTIFSDQLVQNIKVFDVFGKEVLEINEINKFQTEIELVNIKNGYYFVHLKLDDKIVIRPIIIESID